jgi:DNA-binding response OmpR family regulator
MSGVTPHILFVDDEAPIRELLTLYFRKKGFEVSTAVCAAEGRELAGKAPFDLAILDIDIAGENGLELLSFFRKHYPQVPVLMFTGLTGDDVLEYALEAGAAGFMRKTGSLNALFDEVCRHLPAEKVRIQ